MHGVEQRSHHEVKTDLLKSKSHLEEKQDEITNNRDSTEEVPKDEMKEGTKINTLPFCAEFGCSCQGFSNKYGKI